MELSETIPSITGEELARILARYEQDPILARKELRALSDSDVSEFIRVAIVHLGGGGAGPAEIHLSQMLSADRAYLDVLTNPDLLADDACVAAASTMARADPEFYRKVMEMRGCTDQRRVLRILHFIARDDQAMTLVPWLRDLVEDENSHLASKAALILCRLTKNPMVLEKFLRSDDARIRANAVEGLWGGGNSSGARVLLREAAGDSNHRVAANALVELYRCGEGAARGKIKELADHPDARFRAAIAWAIGEIASPDLLPILQPLERDSALAVRLRAGRTAKGLNGSMRSPAPSAAA